MQVREETAAASTAVTNTAKGGALVVKSSLNLPMLSFSLASSIVQSHSQSSASMSESLLAGAGAVDKTRGGLEAADVLSNSDRIQCLNLQKGRIPQLNC